MATWRFCWKILRNRHTWSSETSSACRPFSLRPSLFGLCSEPSASSWDELCFLRGLDLFTQVRHLNIDAEEVSVSCAVLCCPAVLCDKAGGELDWLLRRTRWRCLTGLKLRDTFKSIITHSTVQVLSLSKHTCVVTLINSAGEKIHTLYSSESSSTVYFRNTKVKILFKVNSNFSY